MHSLIFWQYLENIAHTVRKLLQYCARLLQYFNNISDRFRNILAILQYFYNIFSKYFGAVWVNIKTFLSIRKFIIKKCFF